MRAALEATFAERDRDEWLGMLSAVEACVGPVNDLQETFADRQVQHRGMVADVAGEPVGPGSPFKLSGVQPGPSRPAPGLGEHTEEVLAEAGFSAEEIAGFRDAGAI